MDEREENEILIEKMAGEVVETETAEHDGQLAFVFLEELVPSEMGSAISWEEAKSRSDQARRDLEDKYYRLLVNDLAGSPTSPDGKTQMVSKDTYDWYARYEYLVKHNWPWRVAAFIAWSTVPRKHRMPATQEELATKFLGLNSSRVIATWRQKYPQIERVIREFGADPLLAHMGDVLSALAESAANSSYRNNQDRKVYLEMTGKYRPASDIRVETDIDDEGDLSRLNEQERRRKAAIVRDAVKGDVK
jgi:hypothetical protein